MTIDTIHPRYIHYARLGVSYGALAALALLLGTWIYTAPKSGMLASFWTADPIPAPVTLGIVGLGGIVGVGYAYRTRNKNSTC